MDVQTLRQFIKDYPDFPQKGVVFRDISPILADPEAFKFAIDSMVEQAKSVDFDKIAVIDARGFLFGSAMAYQLGKGLVLCRKPAKLPGDLQTVSYDYEYSSGSLSIQREAIKPGDRVLLVDDVLATGNTFLAAYQAIIQLGGTISAISCFVELAYLNGRQFLQENTENTPIQSVISLEA